ncbi:recombinase family protein [Streptomyces sp. YC504]|uniref:Recombinase family protein n=1 Tax=Streptomyces mesophilus TaxID=1775132 RepID=A0A6G4XTN3_9ACTN|nr:recombinase family protein [Streptomyces mesophilus]
MTLIELCEERGVKVYVATHGRAYDPADPRDRRSLLEDALDSEHESAKISARTLRGLDANVRDGKPHGICPFGYDREYEIRQGKRVPVRLRKTGNRTVKASWPSLVSEELFHDVQAIISEPSRRTTTRGPQVHEFTRAMTCDVCDGPVSVSYKRNRESYVCKTRSCVRISKEAVDELMTGLTVAYLARPDVYADQAPPAELAQLKLTLGALDGVRADLKELEEAEPKTLAEARVIARTIDRLEREAAELEVAAVELSRPNRLASLFSPEGNVMSRWLRTPVPVQRAIVALLFTPGVLGQPRIKRGKFGPADLAACERMEFRRDTD